MNINFLLTIILAQADEAGPLWILFEDLLDWLGFWGRIAVLAGIAIGIIAAIALLTRRKSEIP